MADNRKTFKIKSDQVGDVRIADEVVAIIAGLATTEVEGVSSMAGNITNEIVSRLGMKNLSKGILVEVMENEVKVDVAINIAYGYSIAAPVGAVTIPIVFANFGIGCLYSGANIPISSSSFFNASNFR